MYTYNIKDIRVIDGDTIECTVDLGFHMTSRQKFRFFGIDCPEVKGESRENGLLAKQYTQSFFDAHKDGFYVETSKPDKWGRWLATIYSTYKPVSLNDLLLTEGLAVPYKD